MLCQAAEDASETEDEHCDDLDSGRVTPDIACDPEYESEYLREFTQISRDAHTPERDVDYDTDLEDADNGSGRFCNNK